MTRTRKIVVFDLDETLGMFVQLGVFCDCLKRISRKQISTPDFFNILDAFPEFLRPKIIPILKYIKQQKIKGICSKALIFTNNQGPTEWGENIKKYFEHKVQHKLFDQLIGAYKIRGEIREPNRTSYDKSYKDLKKISKLADSTQICFLDDQYHPDMVHKNIYYIYLPAYTCFIPYAEMISRFLQLPMSAKYVSNKQEFTSEMLELTKRYKHIGSKTTITKKDQLLSDQTMTHLKKFFSSKKPSKTRRRKRTRNKTQRRTKKRKY